MAPGLFAVGLSAAALLTAGPPQVDVSRAAGPQTEASIAVDPVQPDVLVAASQNPFTCAIRTYGSSDAGRTWTSSLLPTPDAVASHEALGRRPICAANEWVGIGRHHRQYVVYVAYAEALSPSGFTVLSAFRPSAASSWGSPVQVDPRHPGSADKPMLAVDDSSGSPHVGRVYVAWTRGVDPRQVVLSYSDDAGATWSTPSVLGNGWGVHLAIASDGSVFAAWWSSSGFLLIARSVDGGERFTAPTAFASLLVDPEFGVSNTPAEPGEPIHPDPSLDVDRSRSPYHGRVYALDTRPTVHGRRVYVTAFSPAAKPLFTRVIGATSVARDDFNATIAVDQSSGIVWACFYRTGAGAKRRLAVYGCTTSRNGGQTWSAFRAAATVPSDESVRGAFVSVSGVDSGFASYDGLAVANGVAHPIWTDTRDLGRLGEEIYTTRLRASR